MRINLPFLLKETNLLCTFANRIQKKEIHLWKTISYQHENIARLPSTLS